MSDVALVTGAGVRVGKAIAVELARAGYDVIVHANRSPAHETAKAIEALGRRATVLTADFADPAALASFADAVNKEAPKLKLLVNSAGIYDRVPFEKISRAQFDRMIAINLAAPFMLTQLLLPALRAAGDAAIVNITDSAMDTPYAEDQQLSHYLAAKAGLASLTRSWALELGPKIRVNAVAPGPVAIAPDASAAEKQALIASLPLRREGSPEDVAQAVAYLARAAYVTGQVLRVDGGLSIC